MNSSEHINCLSPLQLLLRDGYECIASGVPDLDHPTYKMQPDIAVYTLQAVHILSWGVAESPVATFDILRNFASLAVETQEELANIVNDPSNVFIAARDAQAGFNEFRWCLENTEVRIKYLCPKGYTWIFFAGRKQVQDQFP